jgi:hypothetical protein
MQQHGWLVLCLYSTLIPTIIHIACLLMSLCGGMPVATNIKSLAGQIKAGKFIDQSYSKTMQEVKKFEAYMDLTGAEPSTCAIDKYHYPKFLKGVTMLAIIILCLWLSMYFAYHLFDFWLRVL